MIADDAVLDAKQRDLDDRAITLIATRQPMAQDLRAILSAIRMAGDLERIGDLAKNIAKRVSAIGDHSMPRNPSHSVDTMSRLVLSQVHGIVEKYVARDTEGLRKLWADDEKVDLEFLAVSRELLAYMMEDPRNIAGRHSPAVLRQEPRAHRRSRHQHRRIRLLHDDRFAVAA